MLLPPSFLPKFWHKRNHLSLLQDSTSVHRINSIILILSSNQEATTTLDLLLRHFCVSANREIIQQNSRGSAVWSMSRYSFQGKIYLVKSNFPYKIWITALKQLLWTAKVAYNWCGRLIGAHLLHDSKTCYFCMGLSKRQGTRTGSGYYTSYDDRQVV